MLGVLLSFETNRELRLFVGTAHECPHLYPVSPIAVRGGNGRGPLSQPETPKAGRATSERYSKTLKLNLKAPKVGVGWGSDWRLIEERGGGERLTKANS